MVLQSYINELTAEVKADIESDFIFNNDIFKDFTSFDYVNFFLIYQHILKEEKEDFFISIPEDEFRPNFFASIFHSLVLTKLYQNYFYHTKHRSKLAMGDLVFRKIKNENRILVIKGTGPEQLRVNYKFPIKNEKYAGDMIIDFKYQTKINPNLSNGRNTAKHIDSYKEFLSENFGEDFPFITDFSKKSLVIADTKFFKENDCLPVNYTNKKGKNKNELPFFNYLIECCNDFNSAKQFLLDKDYIFDEIIIIGDAKYRNCFYEILQECKWKGKAKNIIAIGSEKPATDHKFKQWLWSNNEIRITNNETSKIIQKEKINFEELYIELTKLTDQIEQFRNDFKVDLSFVFKYLNFFYKIIVVDSNIAKGMYQDYVDRLLYYFSSEKFDEELNQTFFKSDIYDRPQINECKNTIIDHFKTIAETLQSNNPKWNFIVKMSSKIHKIYLIVEKKSYDIILSQLKKNSINNVVLISDKRIDSSILYLDKWIGDDRNNVSKTYLIPYLNNTTMLNKLYELKGETLVLCYENIDEIVLNRILKNKLSEEKFRVTHEDRNKFVNAKISFYEKVDKINPLNALFEFDTKILENINAGNDVLELPKEKIIYNILFTDGSSEKFESTKGVFLIANNDQIKTSIGETYEGAKIRFYQNNNPAVFKRILKIFDSDGLLESFDKFALSWKNTLIKLLNRYNKDYELLYDRLFDDSNRINIVTFKKYFELDSSTRFPRIKVFNAIKKLCEKADLNQELIVTDYDMFIAYSKKDHSIRQRAGRLLGSDLIEYVASNRTEKSDSLSKLSDDIIEKLVDTIVEKVIKQKTISDEE